MDNGGDLTIAVRRKSLTRDPDLPEGQYVEIPVTDTGHGMSAATAARAFDPFFTTKGVGKGTGLGLSQVYGMTRQAGGVARIDSRPSQGTTVVLLLEAVEASSSNTHARAGGGEAAAAPQGQTVLVVDDDPDVRQFLSDSLDALGFAYTVAEDGERGLAALEESVPDVLLLDFAMPGMTGAEVAERVRARHPDLPIIFASGYSETAAIESVVGNRSVVLRKPFSVADLDAALRAAIRTPNVSSIDHVRLEAERG